MTPTHCCTACLWAANSLKIISGRRANLFQTCGQLWLLMCCHTSTLKSHKIVVKKSYFKLDTPSKTQKRLRRERRLRKDGLTEKQKGGNTLQKYILSMQPTKRCYYYGIPITQQVKSRIKWGIRSLFNEVQIAPDGIQLFCPGLRDLPFAVCNHELWSSSN